MGLKIREAVAGDAESVLGIAAALRMRRSMDSEQQQRGFLIDISLAQYQHFIANDHVLIMEENDSKQLVGFSIILGPETMITTGIRQKAERISWDTLRINDFDPSTAAYWEQLAFLPAYAKRIYPTYLAYASLQRTFLQYQHLFAAVVSYPVRNRAPLSYLEFMGWAKVGGIDEQYPDHARVRYDIYYLNREGFESRLRESRSARFFERIRTNANSMRQI